MLVLVVANAGNGDIHAPTFRFTSSKSVFDLTH